MRYLPLLCPAVYLSLRAVLNPGFWQNYLASYHIHAILFFLSFFALPMVVIRTTEGVYSSKLQFAEGVVAYLVIAPFFFTLFDHVLGPVDVSSAVLVAMNVVAVDFYVFRVCQYPFMGLGRLKASLVGTTVWIAVHIPESCVLLAHGFPTLQVFGFMMFSGVLLSAVYSHIRDVLGLMFGHVVLNIALALT